jgi:pyridoxamine 5'-phosphate oxidase family protein
MSVFTDEERDYLSSGVRLGRLATVGRDGMPHVVPTAFRYNQHHDTIDVGGHDFATRKKYREHRAGAGSGPEMFRITPQRIVSWGLTEPMSYNARSVP